MFAESLPPFLIVVLIDLTRAGDNAGVIGLVAAGLRTAQRTRAIIIGIIAATVLRIGFALIALQLLDIVGSTAGPPHRMVGDLEKWS